MANEPDDANVIPGNGPGAGYVRPAVIGFLAAYLLALTIGIIWQIQDRWPNCDPNVQAPPPNASGLGASSAGNSRGGTSTTDTGGSTGKKSTDKPVGSEPASGSTAGGKDAGVGETGVKAGTTVASGTAPATKGRATSADATTESTLPPGAQDKVAVASVSPGSGDVAGSTPIQITGSGFLDNPMVTFGGSPAIDPQTKSATLITAKTPAHAEGASDVVVTNSDSNKTTGTLKAGYTYTSCTGLCRSQLLVLVLLAGALGACFHALRSLWMFVGNRSLKQSWVLMYLVLPLNGAALAVIFFLLISAGSGFFSEPKGSNACFWIIGLAALVGLFSQQAAEKLKKIADSFFTAVPATAESIPASASGASIDTIKGPAGTQVTITGKGFTEQSTVAFGNVPVTDLHFLSSSSISVKAPAGNAPGAAVDVVVTTPAGSPKDVKAGVFTYQAADATSAGVNSGAAAASQIAGS